MAIIRKSEILRRYNATQTTLLEEASERRWAANSLQKHLNLSPFLSITIFFFLMLILMRE